MSALSPTKSTYHQGDNSAGKPLSQIRPMDATIDKIRPIIKSATESLPSANDKVRPNIKFGTTASLPSANGFDLVHDGSMAVRCLGSCASDSFGAPLIGLTALPSLVIGMGRVKDNFKQALEYDKVGDQRGVKIAAAAIVANCAIVGGSAAISIVRVIGTVVELFKLLGHPITLSSTTATVLQAAGWVSAFFYTVFYLFYIGIQTAVLAGLSNGNELREKLLSSKDPIEALRNHRERCRVVEMFKIGSSFTPDQCIEMAMQEGEKWLEKLEKEIKEPAWEPNSKSRREHAYLLFGTHPKYMMGEMGMPKGFENLTAEGRIVKFGRFIGLQRLAFKIENDLKWQLGDEAMEVFNQKSPDAAALKKALSSANWSEFGIRWKAVLKIGLAVVCCAALIAATVLAAIGTGGLAAIIPLAILGAAGLIWVGFDVSAFKQQWESGPVRKWDKFLVGLSIVLSLVALVTLSVLSLGAPIYILGAVFALFWLGVSLHSAYKIWDKNKHPWNYQKEVTAEAFRKFVEKQRSDAELEKIYNKMSLENREWITKALMSSGTIQKAAAIWEDHLKKLREKSLDLVAERLAEASDLVHHFQNVVAI